MPLPEGARLTWMRRVRQAATERLALKGAALFFACVLWLVVSAEEPTEQVVQVVVTPRMDSAWALTGRRPVVRVLVVGRARELLELASDPPVARPLVDMTALGPRVRDGDSLEVAMLPRDIEVPTNAQVIVREVRPRVVTIQVARVTRPVAPATVAESALAGLVAPGVRADTSGATTDTVALDSLLADTGRARAPRPAPPAGALRATPLRAPRP